MGQGGREGGGIKRQRSSQQCGGSRQQGSGREPMQSPSPTRFSCNSLRSLVAEARLEELVDRHRLAAHIDVVAQVAQLRHNQACRAGQTQGAVRKMSGGAQARVRLPGHERERERERAGHEKWQGAGCIKLPAKTSCPQGTQPARRNPPQAHRTACRQWG